MSRKVVHQQKPIGLVFRLAGSEDLRGIVRIAHRLWPKHSTQALRWEFARYCGTPENFLYVATSDRNHIIGFIHGSIRHEYIHGATTDRVGYIEGIYVVPQYRRMGVARQLVKAFELWSVQLGCREFASDADLLKAASYSFHKHLGYRQVEKVIHFLKRLPT